MSDLVVDELRRLGADAGPGLDALLRAVTARLSSRAHGGDGAARRSPYGTGRRLSGATFSAGERRTSRVERPADLGPVLSVLTWRDEDEAIRIANDVEYGLTASVWTSDVRGAHRVARELDAGYVWVNGSSRHFLGVPFGGVKGSGIGREASLEELLSYTRIKSVNVLLE